MTVCLSILLWLVFLLLHRKSLLRQTEVVTAFFPCHLPLLGAGSLHLYLGARFSPSLSWDLLLLKQCLEFPHLPDPIRGLSKWSSNNYMSTRMLAFFSPFDPLSASIFKQVLLMRLTVSMMMTSVLVFETFHIIVQVHCTLNYFCLVWLFYFLIWNCTSPSMARVKILIHAQTFLMGYGLLFF